MSTPASMLPAAAQMKRDRMLQEMQPTEVPAAETPPAAPAAAPAAETPPAAQLPASPAAPAVDTRELDELRERASRADRAAADLERVRQDNADMQARLTELEKASKAIPEPPAAPPVEFTPEEMEQYGESRGFIEKVATAVMAKYKQEISALVQEKLGELEKVTTENRKELRKVSDNSFISQVKSRVTSFDDATSHPKWQEFLQTRIPGSSITYQDSIGYSHQRQDIDTIAEIFDTFKSKYLTQKPNNAGAFAGLGAGTGSGTGGNEAPTQSFKMSDRVKMGEDYRKGVITYEELQRKKAEFDKAYEEGRVELNK